MSIDFSNSDSALSRALYRIHGTISQPTYRVLEYIKRWGNPLSPQVFDNCSTKARELAYRSWGPVVAVSATAFAFNTLPYLGVGLLAWEVGRIALHLLAFSTQQNQYIHIRGEAPEVQCLNPKIMSWNILGLPAGMSYTCGGCIPFRNRFDKIAALIQLENPDIVVLQEFFLDASNIEKIIHRFKDQYAHFFIHNGPNKWGGESGLLVMTKCTVLDYSFTLFDKDKWTLSRGFSTLKIKAHDSLPAFAVIGTHMEAGYSEHDAKKRKQQLDQIHTHAKRLMDVTTVILAGDLNIDVARDPERYDLNQVLDTVYAPPRPATCTNELNRLRYPDDTVPLEEWVDQIAMIKRDNTPELTLKEFKVIPVFKNEKGMMDSKHALSDHNPLVATTLRVTSRA